MKIFSSAQIKAWDAATVAEQNISSLNLMERAAYACLQRIKNKFPNKKSFYIFCGNGNNGGDGLALTRLLIEDAYHAKAVLLNPNQPFSNDAAANLKLLQEVAPQNVLHWETLDLSSIPNDAVIVDAIFGMGLNRVLDGEIAQQIQLLNKLPNTKIAIDIPSGLFTDKCSNLDDTVFPADCTLSFQTYKRCFLHPESGKFAGNIEILDIGLSKDYEAKTTTDFYSIDEKLIRSIFKPRAPFSHKGTYGTAVLVGGSYGKIGAIALSAKAALRAGAGKVFAQAPQCGYHTLQTFVPEAMFERAGELFIEKINTEENAAIGLGPGFGTDEITAQALEIFLRQAQNPLVIDADALNIIAQHKENLLPLIPQNSVITPHPKEFERLFGITNSSLEQTDLAVQKAVEHQIIIVLKGHRSAVCTPQGKCFYNLTGNAGMATAGSGDVLTGIVTSLLAQGYSPENAARFGVYLHGLSGDIAAEEISQEALLAGDLIDYLGKAFLYLTNLKS
jgi:NAD(P)H-hydrate epimerase